MKRVKKFLKYNLQTGIYYLGVFAMIACDQNSVAAEINEQAEGLVGYWKIEKDCRDYSGKDNHGVNHGVNFGTGKWKKAYVEIPSNNSLNFGTGNFSISVLVCTEKDMTGVVGDIMSKYDSVKRKGFNLNINASAPGYCSQGNDKHVYFGIDNGMTNDWEDCGRPMEDCNFVSALTVFNGDLYVGTADSTKEEDWCHVFRYKGCGKWEDCGRLGNFKITTVVAMIVHDGNLYAVAANQGWANWGRPGWNNQPKGDVTKLDTQYHAYRYKGGKEWEDIGWVRNPPNYPMLFGMASYRGNLYVSTYGHNVGGVSVYEGGNQWKMLRPFEVSWPMAVYNDKLYVASRKEVWEYDGQTWENTGNPVESTQLYCLETYRGELYVGTWPLGKVAVYREGKWVDCGQVYPGDTEVMSFAVYNGKFYAGTLWCGDVSRYEGGKNWTFLKRFTETPMVGGSWKGCTRPTSLTVYDGKLFLSLGSGSSNLKDAPCDNRGKVFCMEAGKNVSYDKDMGFGWKHVVAIKEGGRLKMYVNGDLVKESSVSFKAEDYDVSNNEPLKIGFGELNYFSGKIREVRLYNKALRPADVKDIYSQLKRDDI